MLTIGEVSEQSIDRLSTQTKSYQHNMNREPKLQTRNTKCLKMRTPSLVLQIVVDQLLEDTLVLHDQDLRLS